MLLANAHTPLFLPNNLDKQGVFLWGDDPNNNFVKPSSGVGVASWKDKFSGALNATQPSSSIQPLFVPNVAGINANRGCLFFDSTYWYSSALNIDYATNPKIMIYCLYNMISTGGNQALYGNDNGSWDRFVLLQHTTLGAGISNGTGVTSIPEFGTTGWKLVTIQLQNNVTSGSQVWVNGTLVSTFTENHSNSGYSTT